MATLPEIYSALVGKGVGAGYAVIPEFRVRVEEATRIFDLVWAKQVARPLDQPERCNMRGWDVKAVFELEGYDVPYQRLQHHAQRFSTFRNPHTRESVQAHVVLYTGALNRDDYGEDPDKVAACVNKRGIPFTAATSPIRVWRGDELEKLYLTLAQSGVLAT